MAKKQTRRTVSINRELIDRLKYEAETDGLSLSHWVTRLATGELERRGRPFVGELVHVPPGKPQRRSGEARA